MAALVIECEALPEGVDLATAGRWPRHYEAARALGLTSKTLKRRVQAGRLKAYDVMGVTRYNPADLAAGVTAIRPTPVPPAVGQTSATATKQLDRFFGRNKRTR